MNYSPLQVRSVRDIVGSSAFISQIPEEILQEKNRYQFSCQGCQNVLHVIHGADRVNRSVDKLVVDSARCNCTPVTRPLAGLTSVIAQVRFCDRRRNYTIL